jgi:serine/threonine protein kinase
MPERLPPELKREAKRLDESASDAGISSPGVFVGTPEFASPEQLAGVGVDIRSDFYSLGVTFWVMVTGQAPFRGTSGEVMYQYQHQHSALPLERLKDVPQPVVVLLEGIRLANLHGVDDARPELWYAPPVAMRAQPRQDTAANSHAMQPMLKQLDRAEDLRFRFNAIATIDRRARHAVDPARR